MVTDNSQASTVEWVEAVRHTLDPYLHRVRYGNLRFEYSRWETDQGALANLAIVYEVPGGSTNQLNISYDEATQIFSFLPLDSHEEYQSTTLDTVLTMVEEAVVRIPTIRHASLTRDIDNWVSQGMTSRELFQHINKLLQIEDLVGGAITMQEMKAGIAYILAQNQH